MRDPSPSVRSTPPGTRPAPRSHPAHRTTPAATPTCCGRQRVSPRSTASRPQGRDDDACDRLARAPMPPLLERPRQPSGSSSRHRTSRPPDPRHDVRIRVSSNALPAVFRCIREAPVADAREAQAAAPPTCRSGGGACPRGAAFGGVVRRLFTARPPAAGGIRATGTGSGRPIRTTRRRRPDGSRPSW